MFKVNNKVTRTMTIKVVALSVGVNQTVQFLFRASESQIEMKYKQKVKYIVFLTDFAMCLSVFVKEGIDYRKKVGSSAALG